MPNIEIINYLNVPKTKVYKALTTEQGLSETWTRQCDIKTETGAVHEFGFGDEDPTRFEIRELIQDQKITWHCVESDPEWIGTSVSFELEEKNGKTTVTLRHSDWREITDFYRWCNYNWSFFLYSLKQYCEEGKGIPFQERKF